MEDSKSSGLKTEIDDEGQPLILLDGVAKIIEEQVKEEKEGSESFDYSKGKPENLFDGMLELRPATDLEDDAHFGRLIYEGQWNIGTGWREGKGKLIYKEGSYEGSVDEGWWKNDKLHGRARQTHFSGNYLEGEFVDGKV